MSTDKTKIGLNLLAGLWCMSIAAGFAALESYKARPGNFGNPTGFDIATTAVQSTDQPTQSSDIAVFIHPRCPCTRATLAELANLVSSIPANTQLRILVIRPAGVEPGWEESDLVKQARSIPRATISIDENGQLAKQYGVKTSGHIVLSDARGNVLFSGGITRTRGHSGDSTGGRFLKDQLAGLADSSTAHLTTNSVFGCSLLAEKEGAQ